MDLALISFAISITWLSSFSSFTDIGLTVLVFFDFDLPAALLLPSVLELVVVEELFLRHSFDDSSVSSLRMLVFSAPSGEPSEC
uniref:Putative secreted protein n=1 Tax=Anopheles darlingi TaxID=43151 RepID=A0A2M4DJ72_ANODA